MNAEKAKQHEQLNQIVYQLQKQASGAPSSAKEPKVSLPPNFDGHQS